MAKNPSELISKNYCGPSKLISLSHIENTDGFRFIGVDRDGGEHYCIVRKDDSDCYYMSSNTIRFDDLIGWLPDKEYVKTTAKEKK